LRSFDGTVLLVSHRPDTVRNADHFWHLVDGELKVGARPRDGAAGPVIRRPETAPADPLAGEYTATIGGGRVVSGLATGIEPACPYLIYLPPEVDKRLPPLVAVHGITRDPGSYIEAFARRAELLGLPVIAPLFARDGFPAYQRLGISGKGPGPRSDLALDAVLRDVAEKSYCDTSRIFLFGYSGGGQFAHRYAMVHPDRVVAAALGAPGWYTFPDDTNAFPHGTRVGPGKSPQGIRAVDFLRVPVAVYVGDKDCARDSALNTSPRIDHQQGKTRIERGERWIHAMEHGAKLYRMEVPHHFEILRNCGHSFEECVKYGGVVDKMFAFFIDRIGSNQEKTAPSKSNIAKLHKRIEEEFAIYSC